MMLREIFTAAGGSHDDWDAYDRTMLEQRRTAVFVAPLAHLQQLSRGLRPRRSVLRRRRL